jgi:hypothetical protein
MRKILYFVLIIGFLAVDFLFFHDLFKPGETITPAQYLTGILSIPVLIISVLALAKTNNNTSIKHT